MPTSSTTPTAPSPQGELFTGLRPDPHFELTTVELAPAREPDVAYGAYVDLRNRNEALQRALGELGRMARSAAFREIGNQQREGSRSPAVREMENRYSQAEFEERQANSGEAQVVLEAAEKRDFRQAFGARQLEENRDELQVHKRDGEVIDLTSEGIEQALDAGAGIYNRQGQRIPPHYLEGREEFEARFAGSDNRGPRDRYKRLLGRQATKLTRSARERAGHI